MFVNLADEPNLPEDINRLPLIKIIRESKTQHRTIGLEQVTAAILEIASFLEKHSEYVPFRVEIWESTEPDAPPIQERRRRRRQEHQQQQLSFSHIFLNN